MSRNYGSTCAAAPKDYIYDKRFRTYFVRSIHNRNSGRKRKSRPYFRKSYLIFVCGKYSSFPQSSRYIFETTFDLNLDWNNFYRFRTESGRVALGDASIRHISNVLRDAKLLVDTATFWAIVHLHRSNRSIFTLDERHCCSERALLRLASCQRNPKSRIRRCIFVPYSSKCK